MNDKNLMRALRAADALEADRAPRQHRLRTPHCPPLTRFPVAAQEGWKPEEREHVTGCPYCQKIIKMEQRLRHQDDAADKIELLRLAMVAALVKTRARTLLALPRPTVTGFDTGPRRDDSFVEYAFDDPDLHAAVSREDDGRYLLHVEHRGRKPGDLLLAVLQSPEDGRVVWARWLVQRPGHRQPVAVARLDEAALPGDHYVLSIDPVAAPPPEAAGLLRESFAAARADDPAAVPSWQGWAAATLAAGVADEGLRRALEEIRDAGPADPAGE